MIRMGVSGRVFLLVAAYPGSPVSKAVKWLCVCVEKIIYPNMNKHFIINVISVKFCTFVHFPGS